MSKNIKNLFKNKTLMITGGTGSFGSTVLERFLKNEVKEIRIFSRDEKKQDDLRIKYNNNKIKFYLGDVRDLNSINKAMIGVDYLFHAAALKQVPSCEFFPLEAVKTNILGAENVLNSVIANSVKKAVFLSTDKAVYPINAMGMSKAIMEKIIVASSRSINIRKTTLSITRYGNVMASRGSVIPLFVNLAKQGKPLTITNPKMTRFLMSLEDSVDLVFHAFKKANQGEIFVQKSPASTIENLALAIKDIFNSSSQIKIIGTRHGEKLYESLVSQEEMIKSKNLKNHYCIPSDNRNLNYSNYFSKGNSDLNLVKDYNSHNTNQLNASEVKKILLKLPLIQKELQT